MVRYFLGQNKNPVQAQGFLIQLKRLSFKRMTQNNGFCTVWTG